VTLSTDRLDDPRHGDLRVEAALLHRDAAGLAYTIRVAASSGAVLLTGRATIALPPA
jgi:hypothetical protein